MSIAEIKCGIFGHQWSESGASKCMEHGYSYGHYRICSRCGLQENTTSKLCVMCEAEFKSKYFDGEIK